MRCVPDTRRYVRAACVASLVFGCVVGETEHTSASRRAVALEQWKFREAMQKFTETQKAAALALEQKAKAVMALVEGGTDEQFVTLTLLDHTLTYFLSGGRPKSPKAFHAMAEAYGSEVARAAESLAKECADSVDYQSYLRAWRSREDGESTTHRPNLSESDAELSPLFKATWGIIRARETIKAAPPHEKPKAQKELAAANARMRALNGTQCVLAYGTTHADPESLEYGSPAAKVVLGYPIRQSPSYYIGSRAKGALLRSTDYEYWRRLWLDVCAASSNSAFVVKEIRFSPEMDTVIGDLRKALATGDDGVAGYIIKIEGELRVRHDESVLDPESREVVRMFGVRVTDAVLVGDPIVIQRDTTVRPLIDVD